MFTEDDVIAVMAIGIAILVPTYLARNVILSMIDRIKKRKEKKDGNINNG